MRHQENDEKCYEICNDYNKVLNTHSEGLESILQKF